MSRKVDIEIVKKSVRDIPDFPKPGILFKDVTTSFKDPAILRYIVKNTAELYRDKGITKVIGIESRGFIVGTAVAYELESGFVPIRKPGKLPSDTVSQSYDLEYGTDTIEMHKDALCEEDVVLIHDDLLATGGTIGAAIALAKQFGVKKIYVNFFVELEFLKGREKIDSDIEVESLIVY